MLFMDTPTEQTSSNLIEMKPPTRLEIARAATNAPELATKSVFLGEREFPILDLAYDDYVLFLAQLQPLLEAMMSSITGVSNMALSGQLNPAALLTYCGVSLPMMAQIVCRQSEPDITVQQVKALAGNPFALARAVLAQIQQNGMISEMKSFFVQLAPLLSLKKSTRASQ